MNELNNEGMVGEKVCSRCKTSLPATAEYFPRNKSEKDGLSHWCKACHSDHRKSKGNAVANPDPSSGLDIGTPAVAAAAAAEDYSD